MTINPYFFNTSSSLEQSLMKELNRECIQIKGDNFQYIPRSMVNVDDLFGEVVKETFNSAVEIECFCEQQTGFEGEGDFFSRFGLDIRDEATFLVNKDRFTAVVTAAYPTITRPREGDLIYYEMAKSLFELTFVEKEQPFYQRGVQVQWVFKVKKFEYNHDQMSSGVADVDDLNNVVEEYDDTTELQTESDKFVDFSEDDPFSTNNY